MHPAFEYGLYEKKLKLYDWSKYKVFSKLDTFFHKQEIKVIHSKNVKIEHPKTNTKKHNRTKKLYHQRNLKKEYLYKKSFFYKVPVTVDKGIILRATHGIHLKVEPRIV